MVGALDSAVVATVDSAGRVDCPEAELFCDWWIGADDDWHFPGEQPGVHQRLVGIAPVVETELRVPGGAAVQRVWA